MNLFDRAGRYVVHHNTDIHKGKFSIYQSEFSHAFLLALMLIKPIHYFP